MYKRDPPRTTFESDHDGNLFLLGSESEQDLRLLFSVGIDVPVQLCPSLPCKRLGTTAVDCVPSSCNVCGREENIQRDWARAGRRETNAR